MSRSLKVVFAAAVAVGVAGCGPSTDGPSSSSTQTVPTTTAAATTSAAPAVWDPCTIPDSAIGGLGLNVATKDNKIAGTEFDGWKVCHWAAGDKKYDFTMLSSSHTLAEARQRTDYQEYSDTTVGSHPSLQYRPVGSGRDLNCWISAEISSGIVDFKVTNRYGSSGLGDPCAEVHRLADGLAQYLPS
ncbi:DUF3558 domain-containing protein [Nocardia pseudobrasiliensis]|nr:DUF3558 domain-containing protein [Nocardia pseudobrasiliensis]